MNKKIKDKQELEIGQTVYYKRQGSYGSYEVKIISISKRIGIEVISWCGTPIVSYKTSVNIKSLKYV